MIGSPQLVIGETDCRSTTDFVSSIPFVRPIPTAGYFVQGGEFDRSHGGTWGYAYPDSQDRSYVGRGIVIFVYWKSTLAHPTPTPPDLFTSGGEGFEISWKRVVETLADPESLLRLELIQSL